MEAQLQDIEQKSEKKKMEVVAIIICGLLSHSSRLVGRITDRVTTTSEAGWIRWYCGVYIVVTWDVRHCNFAMSSRRKK